MVKGRITWTSTIEDEPDINAHSGCTVEFNYVSHDEDQDVVVDVVASDADGNLLGQARLPGTSEGMTMFFEIMKNISVITAAARANTSGAGKYNIPPSTTSN